MTIGKDDVLEVLADFRIHSIRFSAGPININAKEYARVSDFIASDAVKVESTRGSFNYYVSEKNTLFLKDGDSRKNLTTRTGVLHECTHIIADINKARISRLHDEAAAYLAQFAFYKLLDPPEATLFVGIPADDLMREGLQLVENYGLGQPKGFGAIISTSDLNALGGLVQRIPEYAHIKIEDQLAADGVALTGMQAMAHYASEAGRLTYRTQYESLLLGSMNTAQTGSGAQKSSAYQELRKHFLMVYQPVATMLLARLSAIKKGDPLSERFGRFTAQEKNELLRALRAPKPPG